LPHRRLSSEKRDAADVPLPHDLPCQLLCHDPKPYPLVHLKAQDP